MPKILPDNDDTAGSAEPPRKRAHDAGKDNSLDSTAKWFPWRDKIVSNIFIYLLFHFC